MKNYIILSSLFLLTLLSCQNKKTEETSQLVDVSNSIVIPKHYIVSKTSEPIQIDGEANESSWQTALFTDSFIDIEGIKTPKYDTKVKMLWDASYLYVYAQIEEPHIWGNLKQRDTVIFYNNDFEIFIDPSGTATNYIEIEINALGTVWDLALDKPYRVGGKANDNWNIKGLKSAIKINGTLNQSNDTDTGWSVEFAIPLQKIADQKHLNKNIPIDGEQWRINFSRVEWEHDLIDGKYQRKKVDDKYLSEYNWVWSPQKVINMHEPEKWAYLQFTKQKNTDSISFNADKDILVKQIAYALFRAIRFGQLNDLLKQPTGYTQVLKAKFADNKVIKSIYQKTKTGFTVEIHNTDTKNTFIINEEGVLTLKL